MTDTTRQLRRCALLGTPDLSLNARALDAIVADGYTDVVMWVVQDREQFIGTCFALDQGRQLAEMAHQRGLGVVAFTTYMKCQEPLVQREPHRALIAHGRGQRQDSDGLPARWLCAFRPENKADYLEMLGQIAQWPGIREVQLNDEASLALGGPVGCYCDYCSAQFESLTGSPPPQELVDPDNPIWWRWIEHRMRSWTAVHAEFRAEIKKINPHVAVGIQHTPKSAAFQENPWRPAISLARDAQALDFLCTDPYHFRNMDRFPYRPYGRIQTECTRSLVGACLDKDVNIYPQAFMEPTKCPPMGRRDGLMAGIIPFALGADAITPYSYELMKIIPGFAEGLFETCRLQPELERGSPYAFATVIQPLQSEVYGHPESNWGFSYLTELSDVMLWTGLPWRWFWDQRLEDAADRLSGPVVVPDAHCLIAEQLAAIRSVADRGEGVLWIGNTAGEPWSGTGLCPLPAEFEQGQFELVPSADHSVLQGLQKPIMLSTRGGQPGPDGRTIATVDDKPGLVLTESANGREAWLTGLPIHSFHPKARHGAIRQPTGGIDLLRNLLRWLGPSAPVARLDPFPPPQRLSPHPPLGYP